MVVHLASTKLKVLDKSIIKKEILDIFEHKRIRTVFQPIINLHSGEVYAYEALSRVIGTSSLSQPDILFEAASKYQLSTELESLCLTTALDTAERIGLKNLIDLNICPSLLLTVS